MPKIASHSRTTSTVTSRTILSEQKTTTTSSANFIRARSSTIHAASAANKSSNEVRNSARLNHSENEMSSSMHITKTSTILAPITSELQPKQKSSPWFWRHRNASRTSLVRSVSTNKANESSYSRWTRSEGSERPSGDEAYESKTSTMSSAVTIDGVTSTARNVPVTRSASTRDSKSSGGILRFLRASFASRPKKLPEVRPGTPPLSMTQSGLESLAGKQASIAKIFADPNNRLSKQISQFPNGSKTFDSVESFDSEASRESLATSDDSHQLSIGLSYSNNKPPPIANRNPARSQSAHTRPVKTQPDSLRSRWHRTTNIYSNEVDEHTSIEILRQPPMPIRMNYKTKTAERMMYSPVSRQQPTSFNGYCVNAYENSFQMMSQDYHSEPNAGHYFQACYPQAHYVSTYSDNHIYDQPPLPTQSETNAHGIRSGNHHQSPQRLYEGVSPKILPVVPPATAPAPRRRFGRSNYESEDLSANESEEEDETNDSERGGTLSRRKPAPPTGVLINHYSREDLQNNDAHEKTPVPRGNTPARSALPSQPAPNLPQPVSKSKLARRQTVGAVQSLEQKSINTEPFQGSLHSVFGSQSTKQELDYAAISSENSWVGSLSLKRVVRPDLEQERHRDTSLQITIHESKNLPPQKRYFCDVCLDRKLYARTTSKISKETVFWGECFDLNNLAELNFITINLYREADSTKDSTKRRKSSKAQNQLVAFLTIAISDLSPKYETQQWHIMTPASMLPSSENLQSNSVSPRSSIRQSLDSFNSPDPTQSSPEAFSAATSAKRSISLVCPPPTSLLTGRIRKFSKQNTSGSDTRMNTGVFSVGNSSSSGSSYTKLPQLRLAVKYQSIDVLPLYCYDDLRKLIIEKSIGFVQFLEPLLPTKKKEEFARCLVNIHEKAPESNIAAFLAPLVDQELDTHEDLSLLFRSNSICSKAVECYIKLVGAEYLQKLLREFIENLLNSSEDLEVDPSRLNGLSLSPGSDSGNSSGSAETDINLLHRNQTALTNSIKIIWQRLQASLSYFPANLRESLASIRLIVKQRHGQEVADQLISGCLFLRYICPAIHGPTLFGLTNAVPDDPRVSRNLTLLAKVLQTVANFSHFEAKESYMRFLNDFAQSMQEEMHQFLRAVSTINEEEESGIWTRQKAHIFNCHSSIDLGYELTLLHRQLVSILEEHPKVPETWAELPGILASITHMLSTTPLRRSFSNVGSALRAATSASLEDVETVRTGTLRFPSTANPPTLNRRQNTPPEQPATPASFYTPENELSPKRVLSAGIQRYSFDVNIPGSKSTSQQQAFFGDSFESGFDNSRGNDLESITETEAAATSPQTNSSSPPISSPLIRPQESHLISHFDHHPSSNVQKQMIPLTSASLQRCKEVNTNGLSSGSPTINTLPTSPPQKWSSGPELHAESPVVLNFPPPPPSLPQKQKEGSGLGGSSTNIRMGTRAIRMSRERDLAGHHDTGSSIRSGEDDLEGIKLSTVPVILQCGKPTVSGFRKAGKSTRDVGGGDGSILSVDSTASYESSSTSSSSCLSMMPQANSSTTLGLNGGGQSVFIAENAHYFELPTDRVASAIVQRGCRIPNPNVNSANKNDQALLSRVHNLLFGGTSSGNEYQNVRRLERPVSLNVAPNTKKGVETQEKQNSETSQFEILQQRLRVMEEHLTQERKDMQKAVASNMRMMESQERCIGELIEEINRLQSLRNPNSGNPTVNTNPDHSNDIHTSKPASLSPQQQQHQQQTFANTWW